VAREQFRDGASTLATYSFDINHNEEQGSGQTRNITHTAPTSGVGFVRQQGDKTPDAFKLAGTILKQSQLDAMQSYYDACDNRTVFFTDANGTEYEVLITVFDVTRIRGENRRGNLPYYWKYRLEMEKI
jgi:hypothetical protein